MYAIIGEDDSDVEMVKILVRRLDGNPKLPVKTKGYVGCAQMLVKGAKQLNTYWHLGARKFIICYDSDRESAAKRYQEVVDKVIRPTGLAATFCALVPKQEIEAWILADLPAVSYVIPSWVPTEVFPSPEECNDPKERLEQLSRTAQKRPLYSHASHNPAVARYLNLSVVAEKCPSFEPLYNIVTESVGNYPQLPPGQDQAMRRRAMLARLRAIGVGE